MNWDQMEGKWHQLKGSIRERFGKLTDDDLTVIGGNREKFIGKLQERYGLAREEAQKRADEWVKSVREAQGAGAAPLEKTFTGRG
ncbi:MAG TPA: CsbD family protein [Bryobacteraceae bacterium]|nr:CsbD family protein [Bryobacteraceae bacterium]